MALAFNNRQAVAWTITKSHGIIFFWHLPSEEADNSRLTLSETSWEPRYRDEKDNTTLYALESNEFIHEVEYHWFREAQCVGECIDVAWHWLERVEYPPRPRNYFDNKDFLSIAGFEVGTHMDRFRSIHHCDSAICYVKPSWLKEY